MIPVKTDTTNCILKGNDGVMDLPITRSNYGDVSVVESCWQLNSSELEEVKRTGKIYFQCFGVTHPPIRIMTVSITEEE